ncbi:helix-turn-helix domain-containing protein [Erwinia sp. V71]|uniref:helix-turn-helix domain-containing protein n=1 Tax=Erwinia sp. V71 TaxID=3369424 RepID=UPI003F5F8835
MTDKIDTQSRHVTKAGGNVFADLGFAPDEAASMLAESKAEMARTDELKRQLMAEINNWMKATNQRQVTAAKILHTTRPRVSDVVNQKTEKFTIDALVGMAGYIGKKVHLIIE